MKKKRVAIIGMSFRLPGSTYDSFWPDLMAGRNLVTQVASDRWAQDSYLHPRKSHPGTSYTFAAGSIGDVFAFDAGFFGISPREAAQTDPQQRLLLELCWEAMENAGVRASDLRGSACGVYVGVSTSDYALRFADDLSAIDSSVATGTSNSIAANRISYAFDLRGPSIALDTACSSSLVAFHLACRSIASDECTHAIAGGVSLHTHPHGFVTFSKASMLSKRGVCSVFDSAGDGYVRSEGAGVFFLKDYDRALADGDPVLAIVAGSAVNADGRKSGLTVPNPHSQVALLKQAYSEAGIAPSEIDYIEAHGTGTAVGDPVETHALGEALGQLRPGDCPLLIGSVKSNIGHLEAASGAAGLVKALHCIRHRMVPATIHLETPNPNIRFDEWNIRANTTPAPLKPSGRLVIGINSFGFGGANAHVILESPAAPAQPASENPAFAALPVLVSGRSADALKAAARDLSRFLRDRGEFSLYDVAWTAAFHRDWHEHRAIVLADTTESAAAALDGLAENAPAAPNVESGVVLTPPANLAFVYSGNGSQWEGMGRRLLAGEPAFQDAVRAVDAIFEPLAGYSLEQELAGDYGTGRYELTEIAQPALFAVQVGVTEVLRRRGMAPAAVVGHSVGEVAAAWASGALPLEQAVRVIYHRSRLQSATKGAGRMTVVALGENAVRELVDSLDLARALSIAGINSSQSTTVAGETPALELLEAALTQRRVASIRLDLDYAFHSPKMDAIEAGTLKALARLRPGTAGIPFHSSVTGERLDGEALGATYWWRNIREPVRFEAAIKSVQAAGIGVFVEIGPHAVLRGYILHSMKDLDVTASVIPTMLREDDGPARVWSAVFRAAIAGAPVDWRALFPLRGRLVPLPNYPWQRERHLHAVSPDSYQRLHRRSEHPLLGYRLHESEWAWENRIDTQLCPTLADHSIGAATVMPGTGYAEMALAAARLWHGIDHVEVEQLRILAPLMLSDTQTKVLRFAIDSSDGSFAIRSRDSLADEKWTVHATGRIPVESQDMPARQSPVMLPARPADSTGADHSALTRSVGLDYGPAYRAIDSIWVEHGSAYATFRVPREIESELDGFDLHPALLDCTFQLIIQLLKDDYTGQSGMIYVPTGIDGLHVRPGSERPHFARATLLRRGPRSVTASFTLCGAAGEPVAWIREARFSRLQLSRNPSDQLHYLDYHCIPRPHPQSPAAAPRRLFERLQKQFTDLARNCVHRGEFKRYVFEIEPLLDALCCRFAARALKSLSANGHALTQTEVQTFADSHPGSAPLLARLIGMLEEDKAVTVADDEWRFPPDDELPSAESIWNTLISDYPDYLPVFHGVGRVGMHLVDLLNGQRGLEQVLPGECVPGRLANQVLADAGLPAMERALQDLVSQSRDELPAGRRLRIVEIGAGDPTFAFALCKALDFDVCDYVFASVAATDADGWRRLREGFPRAEVRKIDPEALETGAIPANELFHLALVTSDFATDQEARLALAWAKRHLAAGGAALVIEQHPTRWMDFVFGGWRAWWSEAPGGTWTSRHKPAGYWRQHLQKLGFEVGAVLELSAAEGSGPYLLPCHEAGQPSVSQRPDNAAAQTWLLLADKEGYSASLADQLAQTLEARGDRVVRVTPGSPLAAADPDCCQLNPSDPVHFENLFRRIGATCRIDGILHLHGLTAAPGEASPLLLLEKQVDRCAAAAAMLRACEATGTRTTCWLVTARVGTTWMREHDPRARDISVAYGVDAALWGFGRTLMNEASGLAVRLLDIDDSAALHTITFALAREIAHPDAEEEVILTASGDRYVPRLRVESAPTHSSAPDPASSIRRLDLQSAGQLRNLRWESVPRAQPGRDELEIEVHATGLNFRDVMVALGLLSEEAIEGGFAGPRLGLEFAGVVTDAGHRVQHFAPGDRVVGFAPASFADRVVAPVSGIAPIPPGMTFAAAATIPSAFFTAHYALNHLARLEPGEKILIHGAAGGVGIAAIQMAKRRGAEIFGTAGSDEKRDFLRLLGVDHVLDSRSLAYADEILAITGGTGVDVVLNSLAGEAINRNLRVLKPFGRFLELGKRDFQENTRIGLSRFRNNISYFAVDVDQLMKERPDLTGKLLREVMLLFSEGVLHPLPYRCFEAEDVVDGFRHMQHSRHIGKIVVTYANGIHPVHGAPADERRHELSADASYLVTGGLSGFGLKTAEWLAARGATNLVLISRSGPVAPEAREAIAALERRGVRVHAAACDVTDRKALASLLSRVAAIMPPLRGVVHAAAVIDDGLARNLDRERIMRVLAPKILGALHLHELTLDKDLDFFILYSSATTLFGNPGQGSYVAANSALEAFASSRRAARLPALCVRWGAIDDTGYLARNTKIKDALLARMGGTALPSAVALDDVLETLLLADRSGTAVLELDWKALRRLLPTAGSPKYIELELNVNHASPREDGGVDLRRLLATLPADELAATFVGMLKTEIGGILRVAPERVDENQSFTGMGFDSLMKVELATAVETRFNVTLPVMALGEDDTVAKLSSRVLSSLAGADGEAAAVDDLARQVVARYADDSHAGTVAQAREALQSAELETTIRIIR